MGVVDGSLDASARKSALVSDAFGRMGSAMTLGITVPAVAAGAAVLRASADMDSLQRALLTTAGSAAGAAEQMARLTTIAKLPGIGLEEAVRGSIRLQNYGMSAGLAEKALRGVSNAVARAGGSAEDTGEALRQLGQIWGRQKVTMDNLRIVLERVPQAAKIIREEFGAEALADPAKALEQLGINSEKFLTILIEKLDQAPKVTAGLKTSFENLSQEVKMSAARIGDTLAPAVMRAIPVLEGLAKTVADAVVGFTKLPPEIQNTAIVLGTLALAAGPVISMVTKISEALATLRVVAGAASVGMAGLFGGAVVAGIAQTMSSIDRLRERYADLQRDIDQAKTGKPFDNGMLPSSESLRGAKIDVKAVAAELDIFGTKAAGATAATGKLTGATDALSHSTGELTKRMPALAKVTAESEVLMRLMAEATQQHNVKVDKAADILREYKTVSIDAAIALLKIEEAQRKVNQSIEDAPELFQRLELKDIPIFHGPELPRAQEKDGGDKNIGPEGMLTREQFEAIKDRYKELGKVGKTAMQQVSTAITDLSRGITDIIFKGGKLGDMLKGVAMQAAQSITRLLIEGALTKLASKILDVGGIFGKVFGGGTGVIKSAVDGAGSAAGSVAGSAGGIGGGAASATSGLMGVMNVVTGALTAASSIVGNFQFAHMNTALGRIEESTRYLKIYTGEQSQSLLWCAQKSTEFLGYITASTDGIGRLNSEILANLQQINAAMSAGGGGVTVEMAGSFLLDDAAMTRFFDKFARYMKAQAF